MTLTVPVFDYFVLINEYAACKDKEYMYLLFNYLVFINNHFCHLVICSDIMKIKRVKLSFHNDKWTNMDVFSYVSKVKKRCRTTKNHLYNHPFIRLLAHNSWEVPIIHWPFLLYLPLFTPLVFKSHHYLFPFIHLFPFPSKTNPTQPLSRWYKRFKIKCDGLLFLSWCLQISTPRGVKLFKIQLRLFFLLVEESTYTLKQVLKCIAKLLERDRCWQKKTPIQTSNLISVIQGQKTNNNISWVLQLLESF